MPAGPQTCTAWKQTKRFAVRRSFFGKVVLQVEEEQQYGQANYNGGIKNPSTRTRWRDAKLGDWIEYGFRN